MTRYDFVRRKRKSSMTNIFLMICPFVSYGQVYSIRLIETVIPEGYTRPKISILWYDCKEAYSDDVR